MSERMIELERIVDAPPDRVYRMWSDPDSMSQWLCYQVEGSLLPGARSVLVFPRRRIKIDVLEAEPDKRFKFRWLHVGDRELATEVTVSLRAKGWGSVVALMDGPYETDVPEALDEYARAIEIWSAGLTQLRATVDYSIDLRKER
ncbi:MAG: SRPBCC domain-containing protein [Chloroflexota bacterium]